MQRWMVQQYSSVLQSHHSFQHASQHASQIAREHSKVENSRTHRSRGHDPSGSGAGPQMPPRHIGAGATAPQVEQSATLQRAQRSINESHVPLSCFRDRYTVPSQ
jgi:hypothetical protein